MRSDDLIPFIGTAATLLGVSWALIRVALREPPAQRTDAPNGEPAAGGPVVPTPRQAPATSRGRLVR